MAAPVATLDHIVLLLPRPQLVSLPAWLTNAFTVINGGQHAGGVTENKLVLFHDGVYLELIAFVNPDDQASRAGHRWGDQPEGHVIDWALSLPGLADQTDPQFARIQQRVRAADAGLAYEDLVPGGRVTPDGVVLKWATASPTARKDSSSDAGSPVKGGLLPFWCLDRTERKFRVPYAADDGKQAEHPSGATGISGVTVYVADSALRGHLARVYDAILGSGEKVETWSLAVPEIPAAQGGRTPTLQVLPLEESAATGLQGKIELSLFTTGEAQTVRGHFVDGWQIVFRLEKP